MLQGSTSLTKPELLPPNETNLLHLSLSGKWDKIVILLGQEG